MTATFAPKNLATLKPEAARNIGGTFTFKRGWEIEEGTYAGDTAMLTPWAWDTRGEDVEWQGIVWVPLCDLDTGESDAE